MKALSLRILGAICCLSVLTLQSANGESKSDLKVLNFGVVPQQAASKLARVWAPILQHISQQSGYQLVFSTAPDIPTFESRLLAGEYDLAYMNPYHYAYYSIKPGYRAFAHQQDKQLKGILVVAKNSPINSLNDLSDQELAFPSPAAFAASMVPRAQLLQQKISITAKYVGSHDSVYRAVAKGLYPAGGGIERTFNALDSDVRDQLKILWVSPGYTPHAFAAHPRVSDKVINAIANAMHIMNATSEGKKRLSGIHFKGITKAKDSDWDDVRFLEIIEYDWLLKSGKQL